MSSLAVCFDVNNNPQDCAAASDAGGSSCFVNSQEVSCSESGGYGNPVTASQVGATAAGGGSIFGTSALSSIFTSLGQVGVTAVSQAAGVTKPPTQTLFGTGTSSSSTGIMLMLAAVVIAFFAFGGAKKFSS
jgi:hypothetical protein